MLFSGFLEVSYELRFEPKKVSENWSKSYRTVYLMTFMKEGLQSNEALQMTNSN